MATFSNSTTCPACGKWTVQGANFCHHCANPLKAQFNNSVTLPGQVTVEDDFRGRRPKAHWLDTDPFRYLAGAGVVIGGGMLLAWLNGAEPGHGAILATAITGLGGSGLALARWYLSRRVTVTDQVKPQAITVTMHEPLASGWRTYLDQFLDPTITVDDLAKIAKADNFSRAAAGRAGLSQDKWHKIKGEFLRLNYCVSLPHGGNGYTLTLRGQRLLAKIGDTGTNNNKQQGQVQ